MAPLLLVLSQLEVEPLKVVVEAPEQDRSLCTLTIQEGGDAATLRVNGALPVNGHHCCILACCCDSESCCCAPPCCCC